MVTVHNGIYIVVVLAFATGLFSVVPGVIYQAGVFAMLLLLLFALKSRDKNRAFFIAGGALILHHWLVNAVVSYKTVDADTLTAFIINGVFIYAPVLPNAFAAIPMATTLVYHYFSYNDGIFSMQIAGKSFTTFFIATVISTGVWLFQSLAKERDKLYRASITDSLTGLYTYTHAVSLGQKLISEGNKVIVVLFDLDDFKAANDTFGHIAGNKILVEFAGYLRGVLREADIVARLGGDEFVAIIKEEDGRSAKHNFIDKLKDKKYVVDSDLANITIAFSYGIAAQSTTALNTIQDLVNLADQHMYCNKASRGIGVNIGSIENAVPVRFRDIINVLAQKDIYTYIHSLHVARYGAILAANIGMDEEAVKDIFLAGWLHDLGKIAIPNEILRKPDKLENAEYQLIKLHVSFGMNLLSDFKINGNIIKAIANHHERCDGRGYPHGYQYHEIPIEGRILGIADAFSAMTVKRVYCKRLSEIEALQELTREKGMQFDPELVDTFAAIIESGNHHSKVIYN